MTTTKASTSPGHISTTPYKVFPEKLMEGLQINTTSSGREEGDDQATTPKGAGNPSDYQSLTSHRDNITAGSLSTRNQVLTRDEILTDRCERSEVLPQSAKKAKTVFFDVKKINSQPTMEETPKDVVEQLKNENRLLKIQLEQMVNKNNGLVAKCKESEEGKNKAIGLAKKFDDQLKSLNNNYCTLQKKVSVLEKDNKELSASLRACETEKKSLSERWQKLSKKTRTEDSYKLNCKNIEAELSLKTKEIEELLEKFYVVKAELQIYKDKEVTYKRMFGEQAQTFKYMDDRLEAEKREKDFLVAKNIELLEKVEKAEEIIKLSQQAKPASENQQSSVENKEEDNNNGEDKGKEGAEIENKEEGQAKEIDLATVNFQVVGLNYDPANDEALGKLKAEVKEKLSAEEYESLEQDLHRHINYIKGLFTMNEAIDKYNKLLLHYFKALEKIKTCEKAPLGLTQKLDTLENENMISLQFGANSSIEPANASYMNPSNYNSNQHHNLSIKQAVESTVFDKTSLEIMNCLQGMKEKKPQGQVFIEIHNEFMEMDKALRSKSVEKSKTSRPAYRGESTERKSRPDSRMNTMGREPMTPERNRSRNSPVRKEFVRSNSISKNNNRSYHEIHLQRRREPQIMQREPQIVQLNIAEYCNASQANKASEKEVF